MPTAVMSDCTAAVPGSFDAHEPWEFTAPSQVLWGCYRAYQGKGTGFVRIAIPEIHGSHLHHANSRPRRLGACVPSRRVLVSSILLAPPTSRPLLLAPSARLSEEHSPAPRTCLLFVVCWSAAVERSGPYQHQLCSPTFTQFSSVVCTRVGVVCIDVC